MIRTYRQRITPEAGKKFVVMEVAMPFEQEYESLMYDEAAIASYKKEMEAFTKDMCKGPVYIVWSAA